jgi:hypothetical protein
LDGARQAEPLATAPREGEIHQEQTEVTEKATEVASERLFGIPWSRRALLVKLFVWSSFC